MTPKDNQNQTQRDVSAHRAVVTLDGQELAPVQELEVGNEAMYEEFDPTDLGSFVGYRPIPFRMTFPITDNKVLRNIGKSEEEMKRDFQMAVRYMAAHKRKPLTVTNLVNVRFTKVAQVKVAGNQQLFEVVTGTAQQVTHED